VIIDLDYFNSPTLVYLLTILQHVYKIAPESKVIWYHEDDDDISYLLTADLDINKIQFIKKEDL
jgi:hypothetical protein